MDERKRTGRLDQRGHMMVPRGLLVFILNVIGFKNCVGSRTLLNLQANKYTSCFLDAGRRHETPGPETNMVK